MRAWRRALDSFLGRTGVGWGEEVQFSIFKSSWDSVRVPSYELVSWYRGGGVVEESVGDPVWAYFSRCLGHHLDRRVIFSHPRLAVLCAWAFFDGRWRDCEEYLGVDHVACYFYADLLGGRLPWRLHNRLVMEGMVGKSVALCRYLRDFGGVW